MKKVAIVALLALVLVYGVGLVSLGESGANRFLNNMESLSSEGNGKELCELLTDDVQVDINDHTAGRAGKIQGGKEEFCAYFTAVAPIMALMQASTRLERRDFAVKRDWLHPWTAQVTFTEFRTTSIPRAGVNLSTESDDEYLLVRTFSGVKIKRMASEVYEQEK